MSEQTYLLTYQPEDTACRTCCGFVKASNSREAMSMARQYGLFPRDAAWAEVELTPYPIGHNVRSVCNSVRLSYQPEWSYTLPWASYVNGTAGRLFHSLPAAMQHFERAGIRFDKNACNV